MCIFLFYYLIKSTLLPYLFWYPFDNIKHIHEHT